MIDRWTLRISLARRQGPVSVIDPDAPPPPPPPPGPGPLLAPDTLSAQATDSLITLTWTDLNTGANQATGFAVYRSTSPIDLQALPAPLAVLGPNTTSYVDGAAQPLASYYYRVSALRGTDEAVSIDEASAQIVPTVLGPSSFDKVRFLHSLANPADPSQDQNAWTTSGTNFGTSVDTGRTLFGLPTTRFNLGNYIRVPSIDFNGLVASDFVMEAWVYANTLGSIMTVYEDRRQFNFRVGFIWVFTRDNSFTDFFEFGSGAAASLNMWQHHAWQRRAGTGGAPDTHEFFIDGVLTATATTTKRWRSINMSGTDFTIGRTGRGGSNSYSFEGNMAQLRFSTEAFYPSGGFTPPAGPFPTS